MYPAGILQGNSCLYTFQGDDTCPKHNERQTSVFWPCFGQVSSPWNSQHARHLSCSLFPLLACMAPGIIQANKGNKLQDKWRACWKLNPAGSLDPPCTPCFFLVFSHHFPAELPLTFSPVRHLLTAYRRPR